MGPVEEASVWRKMPPRYGTHRLGGVGFELSETMPHLMVRQELRRLQAWQMPWKSMAADSWQISMLRISPWVAASVGATTSIGNSRLWSSSVR